LKLIIDASSIIAFYSENELNKPNLLHRLVEYGMELIVPQKVYEEIEKGKKSTIELLKKAIKKGFIKIDQNGTKEEIEVFKKRYPKLEDGEIQVIIIGNECKKNNDKYYCIIDEGPGRQIVKDLSLHLKGTIGILNLLEDLHIISSEKRETLYKRLQSSSFRI